MTCAARAAGVSRSTVHRWLSEPAFVAYLNQARQEMVDAVEQSLRLLSGSAVVALRRLLSRRSVPDSARLQAAVAVQKLASKLVEGPTQVEDATNEVLTREGRRNWATLIARLGEDEQDLKRYLDGPIAAGDLDDLDEFEEEDGDLEEED